MRIDKDIVDAAAYGKWGEILQSICGLSQKETTPTKKGMSCPHCDGNDRYEYKDHANGLYFCRGCEAGDGYSMIMKIHGCGFVRALEMVASWLNLSHEHNHFDLDKIKEEHRVKRERRTESERIMIRKGHNIAAQKAFYEYSTATNPDPFHPFLQKKALPVFDEIRQSGDRLLIPLYNQHHQLVNLEKIDPSGNKRGLTGGQRKGVYFRFGEPSWTVFVAESWASAASQYLLENMSCRVYAAMGKSNLKDACSIAHEQNPDSRFFVVADNDTHLKGNPGLRLAMEAALNIGAEVLLPVGTGPKGIDASDIYVAEQQGQ